MAKRVQSYTIARPLEGVRALVADPWAVGRALAFVEATEERGGQLRWRLPPAMAAISGAESLQLDFAATVDGVRWIARSPRLISRGALRLAPAGPQATTLLFALEMLGVGVASAVIEPLASVQIQGLMDGFVDRLEVALQAPAEREVMVDGSR